MLNMDQIRAEFPITEKMTYFDIAYGNSLPNCVVKAMTEFLAINQRDGVSVTHELTRKKIDESRRSFSKLIKAKPSEIAFVKNTSEGLNFAANGIRFRRGDNVVLNELEHKNNLFCWLRLAEKGIAVRLVHQKSGRIKIDDVVKEVDSKTRVVAVASTTNLGFRFDLQRLGEVCEDNSAYLVVDAIQSLGIEPMDVGRANVDMLSSASHKGLLGPHGVGFFYCKDEIINDIEPTNVASSCYKPSDNLQETKLKRSAERFEGGNYNEVGICGVAAALDFIERMNLEIVASHSFCLSERFREGLLSLGADVTSSPFRAERSHIVTFNVPGRTSQQVMTLLEKERIRVSAHYGVVRASFAHYNTEEEVDGALESIGKIMS
jgi:cysteine desulfurase/selenocysteine lyase